MTHNLMLTSLLFFLLILGCSGGLQADETSETEGDSTEPADIEWGPPTDHPPRFLFIHHSTGSGFLRQGGMWEMLEEAGFEVHNRTYGDGCVGDNTDPEDWPVTFTEHYHDMIAWELPIGERYDIVAFKSCFPASNIGSDAALEQYKGYYQTVKEVVREHPETLFIPFTTPPLVPGATQAHCAERARVFANWLAGPYSEDVGNLPAYDVFDVLAGDRPGRGDYNCLRSEYQKNNEDSHPNEEANRAVAQHFTQWLVNLVFK